MAESSRNVQCMWCQTVWFLVRGGGGGEESRFFKLYSVKQS